MENKKLTIAIITIFLIGVLFGAMMAFSSPIIKITITPGSFQTAYSYTIFKEDTQYKMRNGTTGQVDWNSTDDQAIIQAAVDNVTSAGGSIFIKQAVYSAIVTLKDNVRLVIEKGATGITVSIDSGATCWIEDYNAARTRFYSNGTLTWDENQATGEITTLSWNNAWNQTVVWVVENYTSLLWRGGWNTTVQNIVDLYDLAWKTGWNVTVKDVIDNFDALSWKGLWNNTVEAIIDNYKITWNENWNSTVESIIDNYNISWNDNWNSTVQDIIANYVWQDSLDMNQNQVVNMTFWQGTSFPSNPLEGQPFWRTDENVFYVYNGTAWTSMAEGAQGPAGQVEGLPYSYMIFENSTATYMVNGTTGAIDWQSTDDDAITNAALGNLTSGRTWKEKVLLKGNFTFSSKVELLDDIEIEIQGNIYLEDGVNDYVFYALAKTDIEVSGGRIDGNSAGNPSSGDIFRFVNCSNVYIHDMTLLNAHYYGVCFTEKNINVVVEKCRIDNATVGIYFGTETQDSHIIGNYVTESSYMGILCSYTENCTVSKNYVRDSGWDTDADGIKISNCVNTVVSENHSVNNTRDGIDTTDGYGTRCIFNTCEMNKGNGIHLCSGPSHHVVIGNTLRDNSDGAGVEISTTTEGHGLIISSNQLTSNRWGIKFSGTAATGYIYSVVSNNVVENCTSHGIWLIYTKGSVIDGNTVKNSGHGTPSGYYVGIYLENSADNIVSNNRVYDDQYTQSQWIGIYEKDTGDNNTIIGNHVLYGGWGYKIRISGNNTEVHHNFGYCTENSGTTTNTTSTTFVFNHGLAGTPTGVWASFNTTAINGWMWKATSTQITITISGSGLPSVITAYWKAEYKP